MALLYKQIENYDGVQILKIKKGSVVVEHLILLRVSKDKSNEVIDQVTTILNNTNCTSEDKNEQLCFNANATIVRDITAEAMCSNHPDIPEEVQQHYTTVNLSGNVTCVSKCSVYSDKAVNCNTGQCSVTLEGPHCYCKTTSDYWYTGDHCQTAISKPGVYGGVAVGLFVLLVVFIIMTIILYRRRHVSDKENLIQGKGKQWFDDGWEEDNYDGGIIHNKGSVTESIYDLTTVNTNIKINLPRPKIV
ncbi:mucin-17-like [Engystomops pustulosus]|uniref:mucin-17-like n=1 Tax=Engystomops pustulosus TaxID=76066 RepID=UPI003AFB32C4